MIPDKPFFVCHQYKAPHDYFENAPRYQSYLADVDIPEPDTLYDPPNTFGSLATRGYDNELLPHIGTSIGSRNPRRSYATHLFDRFPEEFPPNYDPAALSEEETTRLAYQGYLKKYLRCVKGVDDNLKRLFDYLERGRPVRQYGHYIYWRPRLLAWREGLSRQALGLRRVGSDAVHRSLSREDSSRDPLRCADRECGLSCLDVGLCRNRYTQ